MKSRSVTVVLCVVGAMLFGAGGSGVAIQEHVVPFAHLFEVQP